MSPDSPDGGLSEAQAQERLAAWGPNRLPDPQRRTWLHTVAEVLREPMFALLLLAAGLYLAVGDLSEGLLLAAFALMTVGLVALEDPLREGVAAAVAEVQGAGVKVIMVTGDHVETARAIAEQAGLDARGGVISGEAFAALSATGQAEVAARVRLFARVQPEHKLLLVKALQAQGEVVAMTGDGVNDAPALRAVWPWCRC